MSIEKESELEREPTREECVSWLELIGSTYFESVDTSNPNFHKYRRALLAHLRAPALVLSEVQIDAVERSVECLARYAESIEQGPGGKHRDLQAITADVRARMSILRAIASRGKL